MFTQSMLTLLVGFSLFVIAKFLMTLYKQQIERMDSANESLRSMAENMQKTVDEKRRREKQLAKRKLDIERKRAYDQGRREAMESSNVTPINSYKALKDGDVPLNGREQPVEYNRAQNFD